MYGQSKSVKPSQTKMWQKNEGKKIGMYQNISALEDIAAERPKLNLEL